jgi:hydroxymethylpyrimidine pyrophosphatase-like HAD family hydrolase
MDKSYRRITPEIAGRIKLIMTDVDGTLISSGRSVSPDVAGAISMLQKDGITVGLVSGRTLPLLESMALELEIKGPIIAENGAVARLKAGGENMALGYSRQPALDALVRLKTLFPEAIEEREDNKDRIIDVVFWSHGVAPDELRKHVSSVQLLDSGYILHLMQKDIDKGKTLKKLLDEMDNYYSPEEVFVFGDSVTDVTLFEMFPNSVLIINPALPDGQSGIMQERARYISDLQYGEGFTEVALHIVDARKSAV